MKKITFYLKYVQIFLLEAPFFFKTKENHGSRDDQVVSFYKFTNSDIFGSLYFLLNEKRFGLMKPNVYKHRAWLELMISTMEDE